MASNIDNTSIDATYPIAGQDNDSQGFRNNFSTIKNNFTAAKSEIEDLQTNTAKLNASNDFLGNDLTGGNLVSNTEKLYAGGTIVAPQNVSFANGNFQTFTIGGNITLTFTNHTSGQSGYILFVNSGHTISLAATTKADANLTATLSTAGTYLVSYFDNGTNAYLTTSAVFA